MCAEVKERGYMYHGCVHWRSMYFGRRRTLKMGAYGKFWNDEKALDLIFYISALLVRWRL
jgi:hypothetical protein